VNILNKQPQTTDKGWSTILVVGHGSENLIRDYEHGILEVSIGQVH
jgi:hypothetical protein